MKREKSLIPRTAIPHFVLFLVILFIVQHHLGLLDGFAGI